MEKILDLEAEFYEQGLQQGIVHGEALGIENGKRSGSEEGHQVGFELGFAQGVAEAAIALRGKDEAVVKAATALQEAVARVKLDKVPSREELQRMRARFKVLESRLGLEVRPTNPGDLTF